MEEDAANGLAASCVLLMYDPIPWPHSIVAVERGRTYTTYETDRTNESAAEIARSLPIRHSVLRDTSRRPISPIRLIGRIRSHQIDYGNGSDQRYRFVAVPALKSRRSRVDRFQWVQRCRRRGCQTHRLDAPRSVEFLCKDHRLFARPLWI
jgi:hypothetical protein